MLDITTIKSGSMTIHASHLMAISDYIAIVHDIHIPLLFASLHNMY